MLNAALPRNVPRTEQSSSITLDIDVAERSEIPRLINRCDVQIFGDTELGAGVFERTLVECAERCASLIASRQCDGPVQVVLVGAGTSGRLCRLIAGTFQNTCPRSITLIPIIAGGIGALVKASPNTEDDFQAGFDKFREHVTGPVQGNCVTIGVSCGLSSSFVRGCLYASQCLCGDPCFLIGFNSAAEATVDLEIPPFAQPCLINPIVGAEAIAGSVRMKGGTATIILLSAILNRAIFGVPISEFLHNCADWLTYSEECLDVLASIASAAGGSLRASRSIVYYGTGSPGLLGVFDAAECPPTFGAKADQVRGLLSGGVSELKYFDWEMTTGLDKGRIEQHCVREGDFCLHLSPEICEHVTSTESHAPKADACIADTPLAHWMRRCLCTNNSRRLIEVLPVAHTKALLEILIIRNSLTHISTSAFIQTGKIFRNTMIDLRISNKKLFRRALRMVREISGADDEAVLRNLMNAIYQLDFGKDQIQGIPLSETISLAASADHVVPRTLLSLALPTKSAKQICELVTREPRIRMIVEGLKPT